MPLEFVALETLWEIIKPLLSDSIKEQLKPKASIDVAKKRAFHLYEVLEHLSASTDMFVETFEKFATGLEQDQPGSEISQRQQSLEQSITRLRQDLALFAKALDNVNPQLDIHNHLLTLSLTNFQYRRISLAQYSLALLYARIVQNQKDEKKIIGKKYDEQKRQEAIQWLTDGQPEMTLSKMVSKAKENQALIHGSIDHFRDFLAHEFSFKDSF